MGNPYSKFKKIENLDLLIEEQKKQDVVKIDKKLFEISFNEITINKVKTTFDDNNVYECDFKGIKVDMYIFKSINLTQDDMDVIEKTIRLQSSVSHPNLCKFIGATFSPPRFGFVFEKQEKTLEQFIKEKPSFNEIMKVIATAAEGLSYLEKRRMTKQLDYENIYVTDGEARLILDFDNSDPQELKQIGKIQGIDSSYAAPELTLGKKDNSKACQFSFAILIWGMLNNKLKKIYGNDICNIESKVSLSPDFRPSLNGEIFKKEEWLKHLLEKMWSVNERPSFQEIVRVIYENFGEVLREEKRMKTQKIDKKKESDAPELENSEVTKQDSQTNEKVPDAPTEESKNGTIYDDVVY